MELKKGSSAITIDMLLIVHPEKRRTVQTDRQTELTSSPRRGFQGGGNQRRQKLDGNDLPVGSLAQTQSRHQTQVITSYDNQGTHLTVEIHPRDTTPQLLKKFSFEKRLQGDRNGNTRPQQPGRKDAHAYPWDRSSLKSVPLDLRQFGELDAYSSKVKVKTNLEELVGDLLQEAHSDLEKVRAFWIWICHHIEYDITGAQEKDRQSYELADILQNKKSNCDGYAELFEKMCRIGGVQCMTVAGYSKGYGYRPGQSFSGEYDHAWNAVYLQGKWHLLDSTWGSGLVDPVTTKFTFIYNEFYFLTHPALFIEDHFPENKNWQLLKPALSLRQFESNMYHKSEFYVKGMLTAQPETPIIKTVNGKATVCVESCSPTPFMFMLNGKQEHGLMTLKKNGMKLEVYPRAVGSHKLQIFAKGTTDDYSSVLEYTVECQAVDGGAPLPRDLHQPVGPSWSSERAGILKPSHPDPVIHTNDGRCSVSFAVEEGVSVLASLHGDHERLSEEERRRHIFQLHREKRTEFRVQLPYAGKFALKIFAKKRADPGNYVFIFNYLLCCANAEVEWPVFPESFGNWGQDNELLEPLSGVLPANRNVPFKLKLHGVAEALVQGQNAWPLALSRDGYWEGTCNTAGCREVYVMVLENANHQFYSYILKYKVKPQ
ncbi:kyphoscoliosis peptidase isoform X1 [Tachyglossus aculeatus]|uniref:kyphoscoliosis peptidase isoform X1 n=1 Tax=Tachyglossus aculeatus TaxID=9261 RepID=UPI0018F6EB79|nr:kyphoscoliosis peptidase isoform X1 [Tachyglossus aculeatus]